MEFIASHGTDIWIVVTSAIALASAVANLTPTETDNKIIAKFSGFINLIALNWKKVAK